MDRASEMRFRAGILIFLFFMLPAQTVFALSARHHLYNMGRELVEVVRQPLHGLLIQGPANVRQTFRYEVYGRENPEERGQFRYVLFALWRAPGDQLKGMIDGVVGSVEAAGNFTKEFLSISFSD